MPTPGLLGRLPRDESRPVPRFEDYLVEGQAITPLPLVPYNVNVDYASPVSADGGWPMYCNGPDPENSAVCPGSPGGCGDCAWAYWGHAIQSWTLCNQGTEVTVPASSIIGAYADCTGYNPLTGANDNGTMLQDALEYMRQTGIPDATGKVHKIVAYALVRDLHVQERVAQVLWLGNTGYVGVNLQDAQDNQFFNDQPWDYVAGSAIAGGHAIGLQRRAGTGLAKLRCTTWGTLWECTTPFWANLVDEFYYVVSEDDINVHGVNRAGFNLQQLLDDMAQIS